MEEFIDLLNDIICTTILNIKANINECFLVFFRDLELMSRFDSLEFGLEFRRESHESNIQSSTSMFNLIDVNRQAVSCNLNLFLGSISNNILQSATDRIHEFESVKFKS